MFEVIPGILEKEWNKIELKIQLVLPFTKTIHIDLLDGKFSPDTTHMNPEPFKKYSKDVFFELHMMVNEPIQYLKPFADAGFKRFLGHVEKMSDIAEFVAEGQLLGEVGLAIDGPTPLEAIQVPYEDLDCLLFYTSDKAGSSGSPFVPDRLVRLQQARAKTQIPIEVDGGVNNETIKAAQHAGANRFVSTTFLFHGDNPSGQYKLLIDTL